MKKRVIFMGTPQFATSILQALLETSCEIIAVVSQPDRKVGRKQILQATPVKQLAVEQNIPVLQPEKISDAYEKIKALNPDLIVTCAYGQFIPQRILELPMYKCVNVHASLLPKYRGGAPIHMAIVNGEKESGITLMRMVKKMDAGAILFQDSVIIEKDETMGSLHDKLQVCGANLLKQHFEDLFDENIKEYPQDETCVSFAPNISREMEFVSFNRKSKDVVNHINGLSPWPVAYGILDDKKIKFYIAKEKEYKGEEIAGTILGLIDKSIAIKTLDGCVLVSDLQLEGKKRMDAHSVWAGNAESLNQHTFKETL